MLGDAFACKDIFCRVMVQVSMSLFNYTNEHASEYLYTYLFCLIYKYPQIIVWQTKMSSVCEEVNPSLLNHV